MRAYMFELCVLEGGRGGQGNHAQMMEHGRRAEPPFVASAPHETFACEMSTIRIKMIKHSIYMLTRYS